jgi:MGT family glycosyltransferase
MMAGNGFGRPAAVKTPPTTSAKNSVPGTVAGEITPGESVPAQVAELAPDRAVYVTLGTITNQRPEVFRAVFDGCAALPVTVVATTGPGLAAGDLGSLPPNVVVLPYLSQQLILSRCAAVISHCGAGTMLGALCHGLPQVGLPQGTDQPYSAAALARSGAGVVIEPDSMAAEAVANALGRILGEPQYRAAARALQAEIGTMPSADDVVRNLG